MFSRLKGNNGGKPTRSMAHPESSHHWEQKDHKVTSRRLGTKMASGFSTAKLGMEDSRTMPSSSQEKLFLSWKSIPSQQSSVRAEQTETWKIPEISFSMHFFSGTFERRCFYKIRVKTEKDGRGYRKQQDPQREGYSLEKW